MHFEEQKSISTFHERVKASIKNLSKGASTKTPWKPLRFGGEMVFLDGV